MSATVLGCGHANQLMDVNSIKNIPQVHLHFLSDDGEENARVELCCHGCGDSLLMYYSDDTRRLTKHKQVRDRFVRLHANCPNREYERNCPNYRSAFKVIDLRTKRRRLSVPSQADLALLQNQTPEIPRRRRR